MQVLKNALEFFKQSDKVRYSTVFKVGRNKSDIRCEKLITVLKVHTRIVTYNVIGNRFPFFNPSLAVAILTFAVTQLTRNLPIVSTFRGMWIGFILCYLVIFDKPYATFVNLWLTLFTVTAYLTLFYNTWLFAEPFPHLILRWHTMYFR